ncbi:hypothetical protein LXA43DRAFT_1065536 [Ganoderma leucocontextum]|nr:hypothetical protein LXA43DRAFT_1065536 [Ganoderma leucocontextum]
MSVQTQRGTVPAYSGNQMGKAPAIQDLGQSFQTATASHSRHVMASEVWSFAHSSDFEEIVKELFLPLNVPQWQQAVRAAVLIVGTIEKWADEQGGRKAHCVADFSERYSPTAWVHNWLSAQPHSRFGDTRLGGVTHPSSLSYPNRTDPSDWACFWTTPRQTIFSALLGLKGVFPRGTSSQSLQSSMTQQHWTSWLDDVTWVLFQILHHPGGRHIETSPDRDILCNGSNRFVLL